MTESGGFDPAKHVMGLRGRGGTEPYLEVKYRLAWFRSEFPDGEVYTEHIELSERIAIFKATVTKIGEGGVVEGRATGYGSETPEGFKDYIEKAESAAIGRALNHLGYGVQFMDGDGDAPAEVRPHSPRSGERPDRYAQAAADPSEWRAMARAAEHVGELCLMASKAPGAAHLDDLESIATERRLFTDALEKAIERRRAALPPE